MSAALDKPLKKKYGMNSVEVRKGDEVKIMRGKFARKSGKVGSVDVKISRIQIDGVQRSKRGGEKVNTWFHPSKVKIMILDDSDKKRFKRVKGAQKETVSVSKEKVNLVKEDATLVKKSKTKKSAEKK